MPSAKIVAENIPAQVVAEKVPHVHIPAKMVTEKVPNVHSPTKIVDDTGPHVLIVDDSMAIQKIMKRWLECKGCIVTCAANGKLGLECMKSTQFDLALVDFLMVRFALPICFFLIFPPFNFLDVVVLLSACYGWP